MKNKERETILFSTVVGFLILIVVVAVCKNMFIWEEPQMPSATGQAVATTEQAVKTVNVEKKVASNLTEATSAAINDSGVILNPEGQTLEKRINPPKNYARTVAENNSFTWFLRNYRLKKDGARVKLYNGKQKENQTAHFAVFKLPVIKNGDLQQCADSVMRVYAEYFYATGKPDRISFKLSGGFDASYIKWREGYRIIENADSYSWVENGPYDDSYKTFEKYMRFVFAYAGTTTMDSEAAKIKKKRIQVGDVFLQTQNPYGHVVMVVDSCEDATGKKAYLLAQGFMPAQQFHVLKNLNHPDDPWYYEDEIKFPFVTPEYTFQKGTLKHLSYNN